MNEIDSLRDTIQRGFYRILERDGTIKITNSKKTYKMREFAKTYQHFEIKNGKIAELYLLDTLVDDEPWPIITFISDMSKPYGKVNGEPFFNISPEKPMISKNHNKDISIFWKHLENLCGDVDDDTKEWVKDWVADIFQNPMNKPGSALCFRSIEGTGKGLFFSDLMRKMLGELHISTQSGLGERFNGFLKNKLLINLNEGSWENKKADIGAIKQFITDDEFTFEDKGRDQLTLKNRARVVFTTNADWVINNDGSRRFCILNPTGEYITPDYFNNLVAAINDNDLVEQFLYELENRNITHNLRQIPKTKEYYIQEELSRNYYEDWFAEVIDDEYSSYGYSQQNGISGLWLEYTDCEKICFPGEAARSFHSIHPSQSISSNKLYRRVQFIVKKYGYTLEYEVKKINNKCHRVWKFSRIPEKRA